MLAFSSYLFPKQFYINSYNNYQMSADKQNSLLGRPCTTFKCRPLRSYQTDRKPTLESGCSTAEQDLLIINEIQPSSPTIDFDSAAITGWKVDKKQIRLIQTSPMKQFRRTVKVNQSRSLQPNFRTQRIDEVRSQLKLRLNEYQNNSFMSTPFNHLNPIIPFDDSTQKNLWDSIQTMDNSKMDFIQGTRLKGFQRKTLIMKPFYSKIAPKPLSTKKNSSCERSRFRGKAFGQLKISTIDYPTDMKLPGMEESIVEKKLNFYLKKYSLSH